MWFLLRTLALLGCCLGLTGCWPAAQGPLDEQKESNFLAGRARVQDQDFDGAIEAFEKALEVNPHSASAHFELAVICDQKKNDYAAALYHYEKARRLRPNAYPADIAKDRLELCKRELAKSVTQTPTVEYMQRELDRLNVENQQMRQRLVEWQNYYQGRGGAMPAISNAGQPSNPPPVAAQGEGRSSLPPVNTGRETAPPRPTGPVAASPRTHKIGPGDNLSKIAAKYGVRLAALRTANPGLDERRLRLGQTVVIPAP